MTAVEMCCLKFAWLREENVHWAKKHVQLSFFFVGLLDDVHLNNLS